MNKLGILYGKGAGVIDPKGSATRRPSPNVAQMAATPEDTPKPGNAPVGILFG